MPLDPTKIMHKARAADTRLDASTCTVCGEEVYATQSAQGRVFAHRETGMRFSFSPPLTPAEKSG